MTQSSAIPCSEMPPIPRGIHTLDEVITYCYDIGLCAVPDHLKPPYNRAKTAGLTPRADLSSLSEEQKRERRAQINRAKRRAKNPNLKSNRHVIYAKDLPGRLLSNSRAVTSAGCPDA